MLPEIGPWASPPRLEWPGGVFHNELNGLVYQFHFRDGVDAGAPAGHNLVAGIWACHHLSAKELDEALDPLVTGGWLQPEEWRLHPLVRPHFAARAEAERTIRAERCELFGVCERLRRDCQTRVRSLLLR